jgi:uracil-DNA glycosylase
MSVNESVSTDVNTGVNTTVNASVNMNTKNTTIRIVGRVGEFKDFDDYIDNWCSPSWKVVFESLRTELTHAWTMINMPNNKGTDDCPFYPPLQQVFRCFDLTPLPCVKVVILGQDPYPGTDSGMPQACGLAFSVRKGMKIPSSLKNIFTELVKQHSLQQQDNNIRQEKIATPTHGDLTSWAKQGVLLLNTALTCKPSTEGSHIKFYRGFIDKIIRAIVKTNPNCIFLLWGAKAQAAIPDSIQGIKFKCTHPSGISYADTRPECGTFKDNKHFLLVNQQLENLGLQPIDWLYLE